MTPIRHGDPISHEEADRLIAAGQWMIRMSNDGVAHGGFRWADPMHWTVAPDWNDRAECGGGLHGQSMDACGYAQSGTRFELCVWDGPSVIVGDDKRKCQRVAIVAVDAEAIDRWCSLLPDGAWPGSLDLSDYAHALPKLTSIGGYAELSDYAHTLPKLTSIGGHAYLLGYAHTLPKLTSIGGSVDLSDYAHALPKLTSIGGHADLRGYAHADDLRARGVVR